MGKRLSDILQKKELRMESVPLSFSQKVERVQNELYRELAIEIESLTRTDGFIDVTVENIAKIEEITDKLTRYMFNDTDYVEALRAFVREFSEQAKLSREYISEIQEDFENKELYRATLKTSQQQTLDLLGRASIDSALIAPIKEILSSSVTGGASFRDTLKALNEYMLGDKEKLGKLQSYTKQIAYDSFAFSDAQYLKTVSEDIGFEWYFYFGGLLEDSRCFCATREGGYYHKNEIEYWGETPGLWDKKAGCQKGGGRVPATNKTTIYTYRGGYNCKHQLSPVPVSSVPKKWVDRAIKKGYIEAA